jgi:hypothetical protein
VLFGPNGTYCAEPSPDALAAYASSLGLGASAPSQGAASVAQALQGSAGSIGLRTQSITLMRDALYRVCEAYANKQLSDVSATLLPARSQDLTAVVVAVEQLTGAVAANQIILTGTASASASANLTASQQLLDVAREDEAAKEKKVAEAEAARDSQKAVVDAKAADVAAARAAVDEATNGEPTAQARLRSALESAQNDHTTEATKLATLQKELELQQTLLRESKEVRETIEKGRHAALTQSVAQTSSAGQFSTPVQRVELNQEATEAIARAVNEMVTTVLDKPYIMETCTTILTKLPSNMSESELQFLKEARKLCGEILLKRIGEEGLRIAQFGPDDTSHRIQSALTADPALRDRLEAWLERNAGGMSPTFLIYGEQNAELRRRVIEEFGLP